jgi:hypothetical protein
MTKKPATPEEWTASLKAGTAGAVYEEQVRQALQNDQAEIGGDSYGVHGGTVNGDITFRF